MTKFVNVDLAKTTINDITTYSQQAENQQNIYFCSDGSIIINGKKYGNVGSSSSSGSITVNNPAEISEIEGTNVATAEQSAVKVNEVIDALANVGIIKKKVTT